MKVDVLYPAELWHITEKIGEQPEKQSELEKTAEFSIPTWMVSSKSIILDNVGCFTGFEWFRAPGIQGSILKEIQYNLRIY